MSIVKGAFKKNAPYIVAAVAFAVLLGGIVVSIINLFYISALSSLYSEGYVEQTRMKAIVLLVLLGALIIAQAVHIARASKSEDDAYQGSVFKRSMLAFVVGLIGAVPSFYVWAWVTGMI